MRKPIEAATSTATITPITMGLISYRPCIQSGNRLLNSLAGASVPDHRRRSQNRVDRGIG